MSQTIAERMLQLESSEAAEFFVNPGSSRHLEPFMRGGCSMAEASKALGIAKSRMVYWLNKLLKLGLVEQLRIEKRGKHYVPIYCATAEVFRVPFEQIPAESNAEVLELHAKGFAEAEHRAVIRKARQQASQWYLEYRIFNGHVERNFRARANAKGLNSFVSLFGRMNFTDEVAEAAKQELRDFIARYGALANPEGRRYLFKFLIVEEAPSQ